RELRDSEPTAFSANNYDYLLARLLERRGALTEAQALYLGIVNRNSILTQYALWHLGLIARQSGSLPIERQYLTRLTSSFPSSVFARQARSRVVDSLIESGEYSTAIALLRAVASASNSEGRRALAKLAEAYEKLGETANARATFSQLVSGLTDDHALTGALGLDRIENSDSIAEVDALRRARIYLANRHWSEARIQLQKIVADFPASPNRPEALYQAGFAYYREDKYDDAIKWFEKVHSEFPAKSEGEEGYYWVASALQRAARYEDAARRYIEFITAYPKSERLEGAYRNVADCFRYAGKFAEAIDWSLRIEQRFAGRPVAVVGLFNRARIELARGNFSSALDLLARLQARQVSPKQVGAPLPGEATFLRAYAVEKLGRIGEAIRLYLVFPDERDNYFGQRSNERMRALAATDAGRRTIDSLLDGYRKQAQAAIDSGRWSEAKDAATRALRLTDDSSTKASLLEILRTCYSRLPAYSWPYDLHLVPAARSVAESRSVSASSNHRELAAELALLGLYDESASELRIGGFLDREARDTSGSGSVDGDALPSDSLRDRPYSIAVYCSRGDQANMAISFAEGSLRSLPQDYRLELLPRDVAELFYPAPYRDSLNRYALAKGVDPRLILSLARQESRFNPSAKSGASARGLMQLIPETAARLARAEGIKRFQLDDVYDPNVAIRLASRNVAELVRQFHNNPYAVAAAYNTADQNVDRWLNRARTADPDAFVAEIAIPETKDYVAKVICSYLAYQKLFSQDLTPRDPVAK
ncbi:MAG TPA: transglycosylase SLT domain-containing protein, partial [Blastocatellia bacterium]|nr:transglycosylase SLT domain-containing protein [Blastocatellia bacterium]